MKMGGMANVLLCADFSVGSSLILLLKIILLWFLRRQNRASKLSVLVSRDVVCGLGFRFEPNGMPTCCSISTHKSMFSLHASHDLLDPHSTW